MGVVSFLSHALSFSLLYYFPLLFPPPHHPPYTFDLLISARPKPDYQSSLTMGQRHQLFVIARVNGRYRCLGAILHQWLYGHTALRRCLAILKIFQDAKNRVALSEELKMASAADEGLWSKEPDDDGVTRVHFPFVMTCLILGASTSVEENYYNGVSVEPFGMAYNEGDNNDGQSTSRIHPRTRD